jgi:hypothetical protein
MEYGIATPVRKLGSHIFIRVCDEFSVMLISYYTDESAQVIGIIPDCFRLIYIFVWYNILLQ